MEQKELHSNGWNKSDVELKALEPSDTTKRMMNINSKFTSQLYKKVPNMEIRSQDEYGIKYDRKKWKINHYEEH